MEGQAALPIKQKLVTLRASACLATLNFTNNFMLLLSIHKYEYSCPLVLRGKIPETHSMQCYGVLKTLWLLQCPIQDSNNLGHSHHRTKN